MRPKNCPATPAPRLSDTISTIRLRPALVADGPMTLCRNIGRKMLSPMIAPQPNALASIARRASGLARMAIGISGSGAVISRATKATPRTSAGANSARIGAEVQA